MPESENRPATNEQLDALARQIPSNDHLHEKLGVGKHYGSIEDIEEKRFPWLKARRRRRSR